MKYVLVSDIHSNWPSLHEVIKEEGPLANYIVLGDITGLLGYPQETVEYVQDVGDYVIAGNHDKAITQHHEGHVVSDELSKFEFEHTVKNLTPTQLDWLEELSYFKEMQLGGHSVCLAHAKPWPEKASGYESGNAGIQPSAVPTIASTVADDYDYVFHGHTHKQHHVDASDWGHDIHFVNPGSLGYKHEYATVNVSTGDVELKQVEDTMDEVKERVAVELPADAPSVHEWL